MKSTAFSIVLCVILLAACQHEVRKEMRPLVNSINQKVGHIDANHRIEIIEDDIVSGDSLIKIRG